MSHGPVLSSKESSVRRFPDVGTSPTVPMSSWGPGQEGAPRPATPRGSDNSPEGDNAPSYTYRNTLSPSSAHLPRIHTRGDKHPTQPIQPIAETVEHCRYYASPGRPVPIPPPVLMFAERKDSPGSESVNIEIDDPELLEYLKAARQRQETYSRDISWPNHICILITGKTLAEYHAKLCLNHYRGYGFLVLIVLAIMFCIFLATKLM